jgi:GAF domain-containing protein
VLRQFARTMVSNYDLPQALYDLSDSLVEVLQATAAGVALLDGDKLRFVTATSEQAARAEEGQERFQSGPCLDSIRQNRPVVVEDIRDFRDTWPEYAPAAEDIGFRGILGLPLVLDDRRVGSLDVYHAEPRQWTEDEVDAAQALADVGAAYILNASELTERQRTAEQLQSALESRVVIEQAKGVLAERLGIPTEDAFQRIRATARQQSTKLILICRRVIDEGYTLD